MCSYTIAKRNKIFIKGPRGKLEAITTLAPITYDFKKVVVICHPHPLYQGTMHNKVVSTLARGFENIGMATVRFNYRGVGESEGSYGEVIGEVDDLKAILYWLKNSCESQTIWLAGFSFGAYIAAAVANDDANNIQRLFSVAPAVNHIDFECLRAINCPWIIVHGGQDELVPLDCVSVFVQKMREHIELKFVTMPGADHFFHGELLSLRSVIVANSKT